jgi:hypothetical protein
VQEAKPEVKTIPSLKDMLITWLRSNERKARVPVQKCIRETESFDVCLREDAREARTYTLANNICKPKMSLWGIRHARNSQTSDACFQLAGTTATRAGKIQPRWGGLAIAAKLMLRVVQRIIRPHINAGLTAMQECVTDGLAITMTKYPFTTTTQTVGG